MEKEDFTSAINMQLSSSIPIYEQLANFIRLKVRTNIFKPGDKMIPENDLCDLLGISRTTVRQAMELLVDEGLIIRYRRKGSFIA
ncbi:MAG: winged helix-turn-helix transcriptional regulator, partial [Selenomonas sp.]|nr:winged helix-turn-helix transcriptional regulator [Selenomonas sp.]